MKNKGFTRNILAASILAACTFTAVPAFSFDGVQTVMSITASKPITRDPVMFHLAGTNQIVIDLFGVDRNMVLPKEINNDPLIEKIDSKIIDTRARLIITVKKPVKFSFQKHGNATRLILTEAEQFENALSIAEEITHQSENDKVLFSNVAEKEMFEQAPTTPTRLTGISEERRQQIIAQVNGNLTPTAPSVATTTQAPVATVAENKTSTLKVEPVVVNPSVKPVTTVKAPVGLVFTEVEKINLRNDNKNTRMSVILSDKSIVPKVTRQGNKLMVELSNVSIPNELQQRVATERLGTPTTVLDVSMTQNNGRIILEQKNNWDYSFYQTENEFVVNVKPVTAASEAEAKKYTGKTLSLNFQNMDVRAILQVIADFTGLNIMSSDAVSGAMTLRLKDVPWDQALDLVLESRNLQKVQEGNVIWIATREEIAANNKAKLELQNQNADLEPLRLEFFQVNYYKADELKAVLEGAAGSNSSGDSSGSVRLLSKRGSIGVDPRNNMLFVQDTETNLQEVKKLIAKLDRPTRQVLIEAKIVIADDKFGREIGSRFGLRGQRSGNTSIGIGGNIIEAGQVAAGGLDAVTPLTNFAATGNGAGAIGITLLRASGNALGIELSALEQNNRGKVVSNPRLLTTDNKKALIEQGTEIPYVTPGSANSPATVSFKKAVLSLGVTPQIAPNGRVVMNLNIRKDSIGELVNIQGGGQIPSIDTKNIDTEVTVGDGQTVVLGGVYEITNRNDVSKIPFFGDLPVVGNLFKLRNNMENKGELLIFITPYIVEEEDLNENLPNEIKEVTLRKVQN